MPQLSYNTIRLAKGVHKANQQEKWMLRFLIDKRDKKQQQIIRFAFSDIKYSGVRPHAYINAKILHRKHCYCNSLLQPVLLRCIYQTKPNNHSVHFQMPFRNSNLGPQNETSLFLSFNPHSYDDLNSPFICKSATSSFFSSKSVKIIVSQA